jgi:Flp pilus assembly pilin Flp
MEEPFKKRSLSFNQAGQAVVEYALTLVLVAIVSLVTVTFLGSRISQNCYVIANSLQSQAAEPLQERSSQQIIGDMKARIMSYFNAYGRWPRTFSPYNFTDVGLSPGDWSQPVNGLYFSPHGNEVGIANKKGDDIEVYAKDLKNNTVHLLNGWSIWCPVNAATCYYHTVAPGNEVRQDSIYATGY